MEAACGDACLKDRRCVLEGGEEGGMELVGWDGGLKGTEAGVWYCREGGRVFVSIFESCFIRYI